MKNVGKATKRKDRRKLPRNIIRTRQYLTVYFEELHSQESTRAVFMDLTTLGAGLFCETEIPKNAKLVLEVKVKNIDDPIVIPCLATWSGKIPSTNRIIKTDPKLIWKFGVVFDASNEEAKSAVQALIDALGEKIEVEEKDSKKNSGSPVEGPIGGMAPIPQAA